MMIMSLYNALINVIRYWINDCEKYKSEEFVLNLVLEMDSVSAGYIDYYVRTGNDSLFHMKIMPLFP